MSSYKEATNDALELVRQTVEAMDQAKAYAGRKSLIDVSRHARVEPLMIVDAALIGFEGLRDVSQNMQALFASYYLQAVEMMHTIDGVDVGEKLAPLNPNRSPDVGRMKFESHSGQSYGAVVDDWRMRKTSYAHTLPTKKNRPSIGMEGYRPAVTGGTWMIAMEAVQKLLINNGDKTYTYNKDGKEYIFNEVEGKHMSQFLGKGDDVFHREAAKLIENRDNIQEGLMATNAALRKKVADLKKKQEIEGDGMQATVTGDITKAILDYSPISVGKMYEVVFKEGQDVARVKIAIRLQAKMIPSQTIATIFSHGSEHKTNMIERFHGVMSGELEFINHFVFCNDLIDAHRKALATDKTGIYQEILNRRNKSIISGLLERNPSVAVASNLAIVDLGTMETIEALMGGPFKNTRIRDAVFDTTSLMILAVVDRGYERVRFYHRGIAGYSEMSMREIKTSAKGDDGGKILDVMKAFMQGSSPRL